MSNISIILNTLSIPLYQYSIDERGYSLAKHPHNFGYFYSTDDNNPYTNTINQWVDEQRSFLQQLPLETQAGLLLYQRYPFIFDIHLDPLKMVSDTTIDVRQLFETLPSKDQIKRYQSLIASAIDKCPPLPLSLEIKGIINKSIFQMYSISGKDSITILKGCHVLYLDAIFETKGLLIALPPEYRVLNDIIAISNDKLLYLNARKETLEETGIDIQSLKSTPTVVDFPLYKQIGYAAHDIYNCYVTVPRAHGLVGSGTLFICKEDQTLLLYQRSYRGDYGGTWAGAGGAIGEDRTIVYKTRFGFTTFIYEISAMEKRLWKGLDLPRINYEHTEFFWVKYMDIVKQLQDFGCYNEMPVETRVTKFLKTYDSQIPTVLSDLSIRKTIIKKGKFPLYIYNEKTSLYELIHPGVAYTLWNLFKDIIFQ